MTATTEPQPRERGEGRIYQRGPIWWIGYYHNGREYRESAKSSQRRDAVKLLRTRLAQMQNGKHYPEAAKVTFANLEALLRANYALNGRRSERRMGQGVTHLREAFAGDRAMEITAARLTRYAADRQAAGAKLATIGYELALLRRAFTLAVRDGLLPQRPAFPVLTIQNARQGFFERADFAALLLELPTYLRPVMLFAYYTGWRIPSEILSLKWSQVDLEAGEVRLEPGTTKSGEGRTFPIGVLPELAAVVAGQEQARQEAERRGLDVPWVFPREGRPIRDYRAAWQSACKRAGLAGRIPHDLRRTAVRNLERAGVARSVAMKLVGHKTASIYQRYAIVAPGDLAEGVAKLATLGEPTRTKPAQSPDGEARAGSGMEPVSVSGERECPRRESNSHGVAPGGF